MKNALSKTRKIIVDTARQLFAQNGIENTTMNDIALSSGKGRRTLYTYFKSKSEIYQAVIESELSHLVYRLGNVVARDLRPDEKLSTYIQARFDALREIVQRNGTLKAEFFRDVRKVEAARKNIDRQEIEFLHRIIDEGIRRGIFRARPVAATAMVLHCSLRGLELPYLRGAFSDIGLESDRLKDFISDITLSCLGAAQT